MQWWLTDISTPAGTTIDLNDRLWGHIGDMSIQGTLGWTIEAPAANEYAVLPVGVAIIIPINNESINYHYYYY